MNDDLREALVRIDRATMDGAYDDVVVEVERARQLPSADDAAPGLAQRLLGAARHHRQPVDLVEHLLHKYLDVETTGWRRIQTTAAVAVEYPALIDVHLSEHARMKAEPQSDIRDRALEMLY